MYNYSQFLVEAMHEQLMNLATEGVFKYSAILLQQGDRFLITFHKRGDQ